jgi:hypothetical protein
VVSVGCCAPTHDTQTNRTRDEELRFTVHDSPDYRRLKISVFNDDRKTELIGETWANLDSIITPGGGQSDDWHTLNCKGKYAGEIRMEVTYYDTRPKTEKPIVEKRSRRSPTVKAQHLVGRARASLSSGDRFLPTPQARRLHPLAHRNTGV